MTNISSLDRKTPYAETDTSIDLQNNQLDN
jgi:hypothetical protein